MLSDERSIGVNQEISQRGRGNFDTLVEVTSRQHPAERRQIDRKLTLRDVALVEHRFKPLKLPEIIFDGSSQRGRQIGNGMTDFVSLTQIQQGHSDALFGVELDK